MKQLQQLLQGVAPCPSQLTINKITFDSRQVAQDDVFVALVGTQFDGHDYILQAEQKGATVVVCQTLPPVQNAEVCYIKVEDTSIALGLMADNFYDHPSKKMKVVGVTGTNGKTSIVTLLYELVMSLGYKAGLLSTVTNFVGDIMVPSTHTTPDPLELQALLSDMVEVGCDYVFMEVSSHASDQNRIAGIDFAGGVFTNLTRDHLDYHKTFEDYLKAKKKFFDQLSKGTFALTNGDDKNGPVMLQNTKADKKTYGLRDMADFKTRILEQGFFGLMLDMDHHEITLPFIGKFNAYNLTAVYATAVLLGFNEEEVLVKMSTLKAVPGRFEAMRSSGITVIVDYAHTPDALQNVMMTINEIQEGKSELITVVGCGGNRDKGKRPMMASEAARCSNRVVLTSDNPRNEEPQTIIDDMLEGLTPEGRRKTLVIVDRREAIRTAIALAQKDDVILIAGKGHEDYQIIKGIKHHFDDREEVRACFTNLKA